MGHGAVRVGAAAVLAATAVVGNWMRWHEPPTPGTIDVGAVRVEMGSDGGEASVTEEPLDEGFLDVLRAEEVSFRTYRPDGETPVWVFLGYFGRQKEGSQVHSPRHCYPGSGWSIVDEQEVPVPWSEVPLASLVVRDGADERLVYFWYQTDATVLNDVFDLKRHLTMNAFLGRAQEVVYARISTPRTDHEDAAAEVLQRFASDVYRQLDGLYQRRAGGGNP